jgi:hypothetical protein
MYLLYFGDDHIVSAQTLQCNADTVSDALRQAKGHYGLEPDYALVPQGIYTPDAYPMHDFAMKQAYDTRSFVGYMNVEWHYRLEYKATHGRFAKKDGKVRAPDAATAILRAHDDIGPDGFDAHECTSFNLGVWKDEA